VEINITELNNISEKLIFDRARADVDYALNLERNNIYSEENLRGAYNISDRNRVGTAVNFIAKCLKNAGIYESRANIIKDDWNIYDIIIHEDNQKVLDSLKSLKILLPYNQNNQNNKNKTEEIEIPESLDSLTYQKANITEEIIFELYGVFSRFLDSWNYCGDGFATDFDPFDFY